MGKESDAGKWQALNEEIRESEAERLAANAREREEQEKQESEGKSK